MAWDECLSNWTFPLVPGGLVSHCVSFFYLAILLLHPSWLTMASAHMSGAPWEEHREFVLFTIISNINTLTPHPNLSPSTKPWAIIKDSREFESFIGAYKSLHMNHFKKFFLSPLFFSSHLFFFLPLCSLSFILSFTLLFPYLYLNSLCSPFSFIHSFFLFLSLFSLFSPSFSQVLDGLLAQYGTVENCEQGTTSQCACYPFLYFYTYIVVWRWPI